MNLYEIHCEDIIETLKNTLDRTWSDGPGGLRSVDKMSGYGARWLHVGCV